MLKADTNLDKKLGLIASGSSAITLIFSFTILKSLLLQQISLTALLASSIYLFLRATRFNGLRERDIPFLGTFEDEQQTHNIKIKLYILDIIFFCLLTVSLIIISQHIYSRPLIFLVLVSIMSAILAIEIVVTTNRTYSGFILAKIFIIGILLRASWKNY